MLYIENSNTVKKYSSDRFHGQKELSFNAIRTQMTLWLAFHLKSCVRLFVCVRSFVVHNTAFAYGNGETLHTACAPTIVIVAVKQQDNHSSSE